MVQLSAVGDIMLGGTAGPELKQLGYDYPFVYMRPLFQGSQLVFGNLEGPLTVRGQRELDKKYLFRSPPQRVAPALKAAGFNVVSLANNHSLDYGAEGLADTIAALDKNSIAHVGGGSDLAHARAPAIFLINGRRFAFLGYSLTLPESFYAAPTKPGTAFGHEQHIREDVKRARAQADVVIVSFHWGQEGTTILRDYQTRIGHLAVDAGAQVVLGHHPHILQGIERYGDGIIFYSLGNFVFGSYSKTATRSIVAQLHFITEGDTVRLADADLIPINVDNIALNFQPQVLHDADARATIGELQQLSQPLNASIEQRGDIGHLDLRRP